MNRRTMAKRLVAATAAGIALPGALRAQTPSASPAGSSTIRLADIPGTALALSPDGTMIAGVIDRERMAVWDTETLETVAESGPLRELSLIDETSLGWSPDSSALAWSLLATVQMRDSDLYVFDIDSGEIVNLTDDEPTDMDAARLPFMDVPDDFEPLDVDILPSWTADGESLVFARTIWDGSAKTGTTLMRISRDGGEATEIAVISDEVMFLPNAIKAGMEDGSVLYSTWPPQPDFPEHGVFRVMPDGEVESIATGLFVREIQNPVLLDIAQEARKAVVVSAANYARLDRSSPVFVEMDLDTGIPTPFEEVLSLPTEFTEAIRQGLLLHGGPAFVTTSDGALDGYLYATTDTEYDTITLWQHHLSSDDATSLGTVDTSEADVRPARAYNRITIGANGTVALFHAGNAWLTSIDTTL